MDLSAGLSRLPSNQSLPAYHQKPETTFEVSLDYPSHWQVECHPLADEMELDTRQWLRGLGVLTTDEEEERFRKLTVGGYGGLPFSGGSPERVKTIMRFLALWIFYDDIIEEADDGIQKLLKEAIAGRPETFPGGTPHFRGWWELGQSFGKVMSPRWMARHAQRYEEWVWSTRQEAQAVQRYRETGILHSATQQMECRTVAVGMLPTIDFVEYNLDYELEDAVLKNPHMKTVERLANEAMAIINDIYGFTKDRKNRWCNLIPCLSEEFHVPTEEAFHWAAVMHNARIHQIELLEPKLLAEAPDPKNLARWLDGFHRLIYGLSRWQETATRYSPVHEVGDGVCVLVNSRLIDRY